MLSHTDTSRPFVRLFSTACSTRTPLTNEAEDDGSVQTRARASFPGEGGRGEYDPKDSTVIDPPPPGRAPERRCGRLVKQDPVLDGVPGAWTAAPRAQAQRQQTCARAFVERGTLATVPGGWRRRRTPLYQHICTQFRVNRRRKGAHVRTCPASRKRPSIPVAAARLSCHDHCT